jgi:hypothetical protein
MWICMLATRTRVRCPKAPTWRHRSLAQPSEVVGSSQRRHYTPASCIVQQNHLRGQAQSQPEIFVRATPPVATFRALHRVWLKQQVDVVGVDFRPVEAPSVRRHWPHRARSLRLGGGAH